MKLDSWHLLYVNFIKETFPEAHFVFLFRDPLEVLKSHRRFRGVQMVPGLLKLQIVKDEVPAWDLDGYATKVLEQFYAIMNDNHEKADLLLDYGQLPEGLHQVIEIVGAIFSGVEKGEMMDRAKLYSKDPLRSRDSFGADLAMGGFERRKLDGMYIWLQEKSGWGQSRKP